MEKGREESRKWNSGERCEIENRRKEFKVKREEGRLDVVEEIGGINLFTL